MCKISTKISEKSDKELSDIIEKYMAIIGTFREINKKFPTETAFRQESLLILQKNGNEDGNINNARIVELFEYLLINPKNDEHKTFNLNKVQIRRLQHLAVDIGFYD